MGFPVVLIVALQLFGAAAVQQEPAATSAISSPRKAVTLVLEKVQVDGSTHDRDQDKQATELVEELFLTEKNARDAAKNMTTAKAVEIVSKHKPPPAVKALIHEGLREGQPGYAGVQKGQDMLNGMIQEAQEKLDLERQTCATFLKSQEHQIWVTVQDIRMYDARAAKGREAILAAQTEIERLTKLLPQLTATLEAHERKCAEDIVDLEAQLKIVLGDVQVMSNVLKLTECKHALLMAHSAKVKSKVTQQLLQQGVYDACEDKDDDDGQPEKPSWDPSDLSLVQVSADPGDVKQRAKCTLSKKSCKRLRDKFSQIQAGITAKRDELMAELNTLRRNCESEKASLDSQISDAETDLKSQQTALAKATKELNDAERNSKLKNEERVALIAEFVRMGKLCNVNINNLVSEGCALGKIRGELEMMKGHTNPAFLQDCEVTDWSQSECSATCAGGTQKLTRAVSVHPVGGAECPPLEMEQRCNEQDCPIDCVLEDWSEWGDCSAECGGGVKQKIRNILETDQFGGAPCGETSVADSCNVGSCDKDCILGDWTGWSECSKACDTGFQTRVKNVAQSAKGSGACLHADNDLRLEYLPCNQDDCKGTITCNSQLDVVLLLDGSASLTTTGWTQTLKFADAFIGGMKGGDETVKLSVILFSGPVKWEEQQICFGEVKGTTPKPEECGIQIVEHLTTDMEKVQKSVQGLKWPAGGTLTSQALLTAKAELKLGRKDASSVVVVVTDGRPANVMRTGEAANDLRKGARLMWVPVTKMVSMADVRKWASTPVADNIIQVKDFYALSDPEVINTVIADMCPKLEQEHCWNLFDCPPGMTKSGDGSACQAKAGNSCDLGYCDGRPNALIESCSTGPITKEQLIGNALGDKCWQRFPCPVGSARVGDGSACENDKDKKTCDLGYCNNVPNLDMEKCSTGPEVPTPKPEP